MTAYVVTAGYVTVETAVPGGRAAVDIPRGTDLPADVPAETVAALLGRGDIAKVERAALVWDDEPSPEEVPAGTVAEVLAWVDGDPDRAANALDVERAKGDKARGTLVAGLTALIPPTPTE